MFDNAGNISSIIGLVISIYLIFGIKRIHNHFLFKARFPKLKFALTKRATELNDLINDFESNEFKIKHNLRLVGAILKNLERKVHGEIKKSVSQLRFEIKQYTSTNSSLNKLFGNYKPLTNENALDMYSKIQVCIEELNQKLEDSKWENQ